MKISIFIIDDDSTFLNSMREILSTDKRFAGIEVSKNAANIIDVITRAKPDIIAITERLQQADGLSLTRKIMGSVSIPIVIMGNQEDDEDSTRTRKALEAGAVAYTVKPNVLDDGTNHKSVSAFIQTIVLMSEIKVVRRIKRRTLSEFFPVHQNNERKIKLVAIGASTGGPQVIEKILQNLHPEFSIPLLIVQHITTGFIDGFSSWLNMSANISVKIAEDNEQLLPGTCYIAPDKFHVEMMNATSIILTDGANEHSAKPSISVLFRSIAYRCAESTCAIALTGMGRDGSAELGLIKNNGGITIAQDNESSLIFGIPGEAIRLNAAQYIFNPAQIIDFLNNLHVSQHTL